MHPKSQLFGQNFIHLAVLVQSRQARQSIRHDSKPKVTFTGWIAAGMTGVLMTFINQLH